MDPIIGVLSGIKDRACLLAARIILLKPRDLMRPRVFFVVALLGVFVFAASSFFFVSASPADAQGGILVKLGGLAAKHKGLLGIGGLTALGIFGPNIVSGVAADLLSALINFVAPFVLAFIAAFVAGASIVVNAVLIAFLAISKSFMEIALNFSLNAPYTSGGVIDAGWPVLRDLGNMLLILILLAIGIGTMLNLNNGGWRKLLPIFIVVALLINFTPLFAGIVIDISNIATRVFFDSAQNTGDAFLAQNPFAQDTQSLFNAGSIIGGVFTGNFDIAPVLSVLVLAIASIFFNALIVFAYLLVGFLLFMRIFALWFLVILSPLAFVAFILPNSKKYFRQWWHQFFQWSFVAVPLVFFLWLSGVFLNTNICEFAVSRTDPATGQERQSTLGENADEIITSNNEQFGVKGGKITEDEPTEDPLKGGLFGDIAGSVNNPESVCKAGTMSFALAALYIGVWMSLHSSAQGAGFITSRAAKIQSATVAFARRKGRERVGAPVAGATGRATMRTLGRIPLVGGAFRPIGAAGVRAQRAAQQQELKREMDKYKSFEKNDFEAAGLGISRMSANERMALIGAWNEKDPEGAGKAGKKSAEVLRVAAKQNPILRDVWKKLESVHPSWAEDKQKTATDATYDNIQKWHSSEYDDEEITRGLLESTNLNKEQLHNLIKRSGEKIIDNLVTILRKERVTGFKHAIERVEAIIGDKEKSDKLLANPMVAIKLKSSFDNKLISKASPQK